MPAGPAPAKSPGLEMRHRQIAFDSLLSFNHPPREMLKLEIYKRLYFRRFKLNGYINCENKKGDFH